MNEDLVERYKAWLSKGWEYSIYFPNKVKWEEEIQLKISQLIENQD